MNNLSKNLAYDRLPNPLKRCVPDQKTLTFAWKNNSGLGITLVIVFPIRTNKPEILIIKKHRLPRDSALGLLKGKNVFHSFTVYSDMHVPFTPDA